MARKNGIKRLLMYMIVVIGSLFVGFLAYFFVKNEETIALTVDQGDVIFLNAGNTEVLPLKHLKPSKFTEISVNSSNEDVVRYQANTNRLYANSGGVTTITITTTNKDFGPFKFDVFVGDGSTENPWYISTSRQFANIGKGMQELTGENFLPSHSYELVEEIDLGNLYTENSFWTPIANFEGNLQGEGKSVLNLKIATDGIENVGLFGTLASTAVIENINFVNADITALNAKNVGIIAGINKGFIGKVSLNGSITSSGEDTFVGGVVGSNEYETTRPLINMVAAKVAFTTRGITGGLVGTNKSGIIFNSSIVITDINVYIPQSTEPAPYNTTYNVVASFGFGGVAGRNEAGIFDIDNNSALRQTANKNIFVKFASISALTANSGYASKIGTVAYSNVNGDTSHSYYIANNYINVIILANNTAYTLTELGNGQSIQTKTNIAKHNNASFEISKVEDLGLTEIWGIDIDAKVLAFDFEASYESHEISNPGATIEEKQGVIDAINKMFTTSNSISFKIDLSKFTEHVEEINGESVLVIYGHEITGTKVSTTWGYDDAGVAKTETNWTNWTPINSNNSSYNGEFVVSGGRVIIKNLIINTGVEIGTNTYYGLFAHIAGRNTIIENLGVENVKINADASKTNQLAGGFVGGINDAYVKNITIDGVEINNADVAGFAFGTVTSGTIKNITVGRLTRLEEEIETETDEDGFTYFNPPNRILTSTTYSQNVNFGGFAGIVSTNVEDITVHYGSIKHQGSKESRLGGFTGTLSTNIIVKDIRVNYGMIIYNTVSGKGYFGGVAGYVSSKAIIEYSFSLANIDIIISVDDESHAGGIAGYLASEGIIRHSFAGDLSSGEISAKNVGGIVSINHGSVFQVQAAGIYKGHNVGGIAYINYSQIENALITGSLQASGTSSSLTVAGIAVWMPKGSIAKFVISSASIGGQGETALYAETRSNVRYNGFENILHGIGSGKIFNGTHEAGTLENYIVINYGSAIRQRGLFGPTYTFWRGLFETTEDELKLQGGENPYAKTGFMDLNNFIWRFESGQFPKLINIAVNPYSHVEEEI